MALHAEITRLVEFASRPDRLYSIQLDPHYGLYTGTLSDGRQSLTTCGHDKQVCVYIFSAAGDYLGVERHTPGFVTHTDWPWREAKQGLAQEVNEFLSRAYCLVPDRIRVKQFCEPSEAMYIRPLARYLDEFVSEPERTSPEERVRIMEDLNKWVEESAFILNTAWNDYWLNSDGEITAT